MKTVLLIALTLVVISPMMARSQEEERQALQKLVKEREERFGEFARAASARSGIFGNKTKRDLKSQVEILTEIIKTDNKIISLLNRFLDYRTFERTKMTYSQAELDAKNVRMNELTETLSKKLKVTEATYKAASLQLKWARFWNFSLLALVAVLLYAWWTERRR